MAQTGGFKRILDKFRKSKLAIPFALCSPAFICYLLLIFGSVLFCLLPAVIALIIYRPAALLRLGEPQEAVDLGNDLILFSGSLLASRTIPFLTAESPVTLSTTDNVLTGGSITPFRGTDSTNFTFLESHLTQERILLRTYFVTVYDYYLANRGH